MNSSTQFQCHIYSSLWSTPEKPFQMQLSPARHGTEINFGWRWVACTMARNVGLLLWDTDPQDLYMRVLYVTPLQLLHKYLSFAYAFTHLSSQPFLKMKSFPFQYYCRVMCKRTLTGWGIPMKWRWWLNTTPLTCLCLWSTCAFVIVCAGKPAHHHSGDKSYPVQLLEIHFGCQAKCGDSL